MMYGIYGSQLDEICLFVGSELWNSFSSCDNNIAKIKYFTEMGRKLAADVRKCHTESAKYRQGIDAQGMAEVYNFQV